MSNIEKVKQHIKFSLNELSSENRHHEFEHVCRYVARKRICSNIVPATGPVSAYGDQGEDFASYRTYLKNEFGDSAFIGLINEGHIVFACSIQAENIETKIKKDVEKIIKNDLSPTDIHFFSTQNITVGKKHELQKWAKDKKDVHLEIYDLSALSEFMTDFDLFWVAIEFLKVPAEIYPEPIDPKFEKYLSLYEKFKGDNTQLSLNYGEFFDLKYCVRRATFSEKVNKDLPILLSKLDYYISNASSNELIRFARYEYIVAAIRGLDSFDSVETKVRYVFEEDLDVDDIGELEKRQILLTYLKGATARGICNIPSSDQIQWGEKLCDIVSKYLDSTESQSQKHRCYLIMGGISVFQFDTPEGIITNAGSWWEKIVDEIESVPYFPVESFSDQITEYMKLLGCNDQMERIACKIDEVLSKRVGSSSSAQKCRDRSLIYYQQGNICKAIDLIHDAKVKWFHKESMKGVLLSLMTLSQWYSQLGLMYAAKYFSLGAFRFAFSSDDEELKKYTVGISEAISSYDYRTGAWLTFLDDVKVFFGVYGMFNPDPEDNIFLDEESSIIAGHVSLLRTVLEKIDPRVLKDIDSVIESGIGNLNFYEESTKSAEDNFADFSLEDFEKTIKEQLHGIPFSDCGEKRCFRLNLFGVSLDINCKNVYSDVRAVESFLSFLQILILDFATHFDLYIVPAKAEIMLTVDKTGETKQIPDNKITRWGIQWPDSNTEETRRIKLAIVFQVLNEMSLLPSKKLWDIFDERAKEGLFDKIFSVNDYEYLLDNLTTKDIYEVELRYKTKPLFDVKNYQLIQNSDLAWNNSVAQEYSEASSKEAIKRRYQLGMEAIKYTLPSLLKDEGFRKTISILRSEGWLDWHLIGAVGNVVINYRARKIIEEKRVDFNETQKVYSSFIGRLEQKEERAVPVEEFTLEKMNFALKLNIFSTLKGLGLEIKQDTPNIEGVKTFVKEKLNYFNDDITHEDYFKYEVSE